MNEKTTVLVADSSRVVVWCGRDLTFRAAKPRDTHNPRTLRLTDIGTIDMSAAIFGAIAIATLGIAAAVKGLPAYVISALGAACAFATLEAADTVIPYPCLAGPHAAVVAILFAAPAKGLYDTAFAVLGGHIVAAGIAILQLKLLPPSAAFLTKTIVVTLAVGAQKALGTVHPPACAIAFVWATSGQDDPMKLVGPLIGCTILIVVQQAFIALTASKPKKA